jgi:photosystem II stability/assembly factor-like uncharacterized protein
LPIRGLFDYWDENQINRYVAITSKKIFSRAAGEQSWSELYSQTAELVFPVKPVVYLRERPIVVGFDTNRLIEPETTYLLGINGPGYAPDVGFASEEGVPGQQLIESVSIVRGDNPGEDRIFCFNSFDGVFLAGTGIEGRILRSIDGSKTWTDLGTQAGQNRIFSIDCRGASVACAGTGPDGKILRSIDAGLNWTVIKETGQTWVRAIKYTHDYVWLAGTYAALKIFRSIDNGENWSEVANVPVGEEGIFCFEKMDNPDIILAGTYPNAHILRSIDNGETWTDLGSMLPASPTPQWLHTIKNMGNGVVLAGCAGNIGIDSRILISEDNGATWETLVIFPELYGIFSIEKLEEGIVLGCASDGNISSLLRSKDGGLTWENLGPQFNEVDLWYAYYNATLPKSALIGTYPAGLILRYEFYWGEGGGQPGDGNLTGTFKYVVTYMRSGNFQVESTPSPASNPITVTNGKIKLSNIPVSDDPKVDKKRIYRTTEGGEIFFWLADIDNDTTEYIDNITELGDEVSYDRYPPPPAVCAEVWDDRVWFVPKSDRNQLQFTNKGSAEEMAHDNIIQVKGKDSDEIMMIKAYMDSLYILKHRSLWRLDKIGESSYELTRLPFSTGTDAPASVAVGGGLMKWYSKRGLEVFNGQFVLDPPVSNLIPKTLATINQAAIAKSFGEINEKEGEYWLSVPSGTSTEPDLVIVFDYLRGKISLYRFAKKLTAMHNIRDANSDLQFITGSSDGNLYIQDSGWTDDGTVIEANFMTKQYCCLTNEKGLWNVLRRLFAEYICPAGSKVTMNVYRNQGKFPVVSVSLEGITPSDLDETREVIMRRVNLGLSCAYFCLEFVHNETSESEVRILTPDIYFKRRIWKRNIEAD